jgi:hypothetical protein
MMSEADEVRASFEKASVEIKLDAAEKRIAELEAKTAWRLVETAPKDGTWILLGWFELSGQTMREVAFWHSTKKVWCQTHRAFGKEIYQQPTHWMPLPEPPR